MRLTIKKIRLERPQRWRHRFVKDAVYWLKLQQDEKVREDASYSIVSYCIITVMLRRGRFYNSKEDIFTDGDRNMDRHFVNCSRQTQSETILPRSSH